MSHLSPFLTDQKHRLRQLISDLSEEFSYVSVLGVDTAAKSYEAKRSGSAINDSIWSERGFVARVYNGNYYSEYSFNTLNEETYPSVVEKITATAKDSVKALSSKGLSHREYDLLKENELIKSSNKKVKIPPSSVGPKEKIEKMTETMDHALTLSNELVDCRVRYEEVTISKVFLSTAKDLEQSYTYSTAALIPIAVRDGNMKYSFKSLSGLKGVEILDELYACAEPAVNEVIELLGAEPVSPGEYDIICDPDMSGLIAHEAFGHGVEMDMFVKHRAKAEEFIDKRVGSDLVVMHDGATSADEVSSYLFDDEGTLGTDTKIIENGILKRGISDALSAMQLGTLPTGNGKRESYERKAYTRMTNTFFAPGKDNLEDMIKSISKGYLLEGFQSGMEDPKNWGIQCVAMKGREIIDGKITGKIVAPVFLTGYVPDLLESITMVSNDLELSGSGACGKGHKEWVKTSTGGPFIKCKGRLG
ncbi:MULTISPECIES: TldD/PmbA family protein [unclassified Fusibacter]|uniref:TldD/PmbA family protein n=1 Tax=unclassified Fusibacter TaxID=2624464 RepID=UPI001010968A|nr:MULTISPECIES: TldD/PmbA family protein [unclassified Fusibacter]MCK8060487.1 TldD/PmbA family protein [Fusibacter sp. A2]NPE20224.1 TldD/PmbA family protein [Fusibacter sp. A1]RXV63432.1 TldD/PmbA family protein [Fusibacter sp. A1]